MAASMKVHAGSKMSPFGAFRTVPNAPNHFTYDQAYSLMQNNKNSQFFAELKGKHIVLSPKHIGNVKKGIREQLNQELSVYSKQFDGVPVAYKNIKMMRSTGRIIADLPCIHFDIEAEFIIFKPRIGSRLTGVINKLGKKHVGCLVHKCFNASMHVGHGQRVSLSPSLIGKEVAFTVTAIYTNSNVLSLKGQPCHNDWSNLISCTKDDSVSHATTASPGTDEHNTSHPENVEDVSHSVKKHKSKKEKRKSKQGRDVKSEDDTNCAKNISNTVEGCENGELDISMAFTDTTASSSTKKKKKKKKHKSEGKDSDSEAHNDSALNRTDDDQGISMECPLSKKKRGKRKHTEMECGENRLLEVSLDKSTQSVEQLQNVAKKPRIESLDEGISVSALDESESTNSLPDARTPSCNNSKSKKKKKKSKKVAVEESIEL